jgi:hypothetical protein
VILRNLPPTSAYWRARHGTGDWTPTEYVLADLWDVAVDANWQRANNRHAPRPKRYPRPLEEDRQMAETIRRMRAAGFAGKTR